MNHELIGLLAFIFFLLGCSFSLFKRSKSIRSKFNLPIKKLLEYHCIFSIIAIILVFIHAKDYFSDIRFSTGYISLLLMILVTIIGIIMKYFKNIYLKHRLLFLYAHIILAIMLGMMILFHILSYLIFLYC